MKLKANLKPVIIFIFLFFFVSVISAQEANEVNEVNFDNKLEEEPHIIRYEYIDLISGKHSFSILEDKNERKNENYELVRDFGHIVNALHACPMSSDFKCMYGGNFILSYPRDGQEIGESWSFRGRNFTLINKVPRYIDNRLVEFNVVTSEFGQEIIRFYFNYDYGFYTIMTLKKNNGFDEAMFDDVLIPVAISQATGKGYGSN